MQAQITIKSLFHNAFSLIILTGVLSGSFSQVLAAMPMRQSTTAFLFNVSPVYSANLLNISELSQTATADVQIPNCPDANGTLRGTTRLSLGEEKNKSAIAQTAIKTGTTVEAKITAYIDDTAELTHFDLSGETIENATRAATFTVEENKIGASAALSHQQGRTMITISPGLDVKNGERLEQATRNAVKAIIEQTSAKLHAARKEWRNGACVEVKLTAPKTRLAAGEKIVVIAESRHKLEKIALPAKLIKKEATASATPDELRGVPQARFTLTAPQTADKAMIAVESVSKRGIGYGKLEFEANAIVARVPIRKTQSPPKKTPPQSKTVCKAPWYGKIKIEKRLKQETSKPESGRLLRDIYRKNETINLEYNVLGIQDPAGGFVNGFFADTQMSYRSLSYQENFYAAGKSMCDKRVITSTQLKTMEIALTAAASKRTTVYISPWGEKGILTLSSPEINAEQIITRKYDTGCPSFDEPNNTVEKSDRLVDIVAPSFEIHFELDAKSNYQLVGSKTIQNSDGSETLVSWNMTRDCK